MMRTSCAMPENPSTIAGIGRCPSMSPTFSQLQGASRKSREKRPPTLAWKTTTPVYMSTSASRKLGIARPMKPMKVKT